MTDKVMDFYKSILSFSGMKVNSDGTIYSQLGSDESTKTIPTINGEPLVFPQESQFKDPDQNKVYFHPLAESFIRGESEVIQALKERISVRLNYTFPLVVEGLLTLLVTPELHKELTQDQVELLKYVKDVDPKSKPPANINWADDMVRQIKKDYQGCYIKLYLKNSGILNGETYARLGVVKFPFYQDLKDGKYEKQFRASDASAFGKVIEFIFPDIKVQDVYNYGTRSQTAPFLNVLLNTAGRLAVRFNEIINLYSKYIQVSDSLLFDMDWAKDIDDLDKIIKQSNKLPDLKGNIGTVSVKERNHPGQEIPSKLPPPPKTEIVTNYSVSQPRNETVPVNQANVQQPVIPQNNQLVNPAVVPNNDGKISFSDVMRSNPTVMQTPNIFADQMQWQQPMGNMRQRVPGWAQNNNNMFNNQFNGGIQQPPPGYQWVMGPNNVPVLAPIQNMQMPYNSQPQQYNNQPQPGQQWVIGPNGVPVLVNTNQGFNNQGPLPPTGWSYR